MVDAAAQVVSPTCPACHAQIGADDISLDKGTMLCKACGRIAFLPSRGDLEAEGEGDMPWTPDAPVSPPARPSTSVQRSGDDLVLTRRCGSIGSGVFFLLFLCAWTPFLVMMGDKIIRSPSAETMLFALPFAAAEVFLLLLVPYMFLGRERLHISPDGIHYAWTVGIRLGSRVIPLERFHGVRRAWSGGHSDSGERRYALSIETGDGPIQFARGVQQAELLWLNDAIQGHIALLAPQPCFQNAAGRVTSPGRSAVTVVSAAASQIGIPQTTSIRLTRGNNQTRVTLKLPLGASLASVGGLLLLNVFWNGMVAIFALQWIKEFSWFLFLFMIPFEAIGLGMFVLLVCALVLPFWRTVWLFRSGEVIRYTGVPGFSRKRRHEFRGIERMEIRRGPAPPSRSHLSKASAQGPCLLALVGTEGQDVVQIEGVTESEADWLGRELLDDFRRWGLLVVN